MSYALDHNISSIDASRTRETIQQRIDQFLALYGVALDGTESGPRGVSQNFMDTLDRVDKKHLEAGEQCGICATDFLDDDYPLVVALPCQGKHRFDLLCVSQWLETNATCPMCRHDFLAPKPKKHIPPPEDDEEEYDDMYG